MASFMIEKICKNPKCGKKFLVYNCWVKKGAGKYCSVRCRGIGKSLFEAGRNSSYWKGLNSKCEECGKIFHIEPAQKGIKKYCGNKCKDKAHSKNMSGPKHPCWEGGKVIKICSICNKEFYVFPKGSRKFCSRKCSGKWTSKNNLGENNPSWKGGMTPFYLHIRKSKLYYRWRKEIFRRDNFTCQRCNRTNVRLHAHHYKKFSDIMKYFKDNFPLFSISNPNSELWDAKNGITLCMECHKKEHDKHGYRNTI